MAKSKLDLVDDIHEILSEPDYSSAKLGNRLGREHPIDIAIAMQYLDEEERLAILSTLDNDVVAVVLDETDEETKRSFLERVGEERLAELIELMPPDEGADLLELAPEEMEEEVLEHVEKETAQELRQLRQYEPDTAGGQMTTEFVALDDGMTAADAIKAIQGAVDAEVVSWIHVTDSDDRLCGVVSIQQIVSAPAEKSLADFMYRDVRSVTTDVDQEEVAQLADKYNLPSVPVTDPGGRLKGIVTLDDVMDVMSEEASEDIYLLSGTQSIHPMAESIGHRVLKRMPWLLVTVGMGLVMIFLYRQHKEFIEAKGIWLVFFVPIVQALGGNVGIQASTLVVRGLATGELESGRMRRVMITEVGVGLIIGIVFGIFVGIVAGLTEGNMALGIIVTIAIICGVGMASLTGTVIPLVCNRYGVDPAITAGPFITALNDVMCLTIYYGIAWIILETFKSSFA